MIRFRRWVCLGRLMMDTFGILLLYVVVGCVAADTPHAHPHVVMMSINVYVQYENTIVNHMLNSIEAIRCILLGWRQSKLLY